MEAWRGAFVLLCASFVCHAEGLKTIGDMFPYKHEAVKKFPFPIPPIPGWDPDTKPWDDYLYPPLNPKPKELTSHRGKPKVRLTSDSPALNGSVITFTAKLEYPPCQKEDSNGDLVWDNHCQDANGQLNSGYVYNWTSWMDDYGFGKCTDAKRCNVFPDGKAFPQTNDWKRRSYVYVWHALGQYSETCDGSSSSVTINTTDISLGAEVMEVMVYRKRERRKYSPLTTDNAVFYVTDKIPVAVTISQKSAVNQSQNVFFRGEDVLFQVRLHDPSGYLRTATSVDFLWDFRDGNQLVTHRNVTTHAYSRLGAMEVKLVVEAAFVTECPPTAATPTQMSSTPAPPTEVPTHAATIRIKTTQAPSTTRQPLTSSSTTTTSPGTLAPPTTEPLQTTAPFDPDLPTSSPAALRRRRLGDNQCFRYAHGAFVGNITIIERSHAVRSQPTNRILDVSASHVSDRDVNFLVRCLGSLPVSACTIVSDHSCTQVRAIRCDDVPPSPRCEVHLTRTFSEPGTYCVNISLVDSSSLTRTSTVVTINKSSQDAPASRSPSTAALILCSTAVLGTVFAFVAYLVCRRYKVYPPVRGPLRGNSCCQVGVAGRFLHLQNAFFPSNEERDHLLTERRPL